MEVAGEPGRDLALAIQLDAPCVVSPQIMRPSFFEKAMLSLQATAAACWWRWRPIYTSRIAPQYSSLKVEAWSLTSEPAKPTPDLVTMPWSVAKLASQASLRVGRAFCWGSSGSASGCAEAPAPIVLVRTGLPACTTGPPLRLPTSKYVS